MSEFFAAARGLTVSSPAIAVVAGQPTLLPLKLEGTEGINQLFDYRLTLQTPDGLNVGAMSNLSLNAMVGLEITCFLELEDQGNSLGGVREISALITQARFVGGDNRHATYELTLRPWLYLTTLRSDCKVFQNQTPLETIAAVLSNYSFAWTTRLVETYPKLHNANTFSFKASPDVGANAEHKLGHHGYRAAQDAQSRSEDYGLNSNT